MFQRDGMQIRAIRRLYLPHVPAKFEPQPTMAGHDALQAKVFGKVIDVLLRPPGKFAILTQSRSEQILKNEACMAQEGFIAIKSVYGEEHAYSLTFAMKVGMILFNCRQRSLADRTIQEVVETMKRVLGPDNITTLRAMQNQSLIQMVEKK